MSENDYISLTQATRYCDYSQEYLSLRARQGKLKAIKFGRNWVTKKEWLEEYLKSNSKKHKEVKKAGISFSSLFKQPKLRYALRYAIAGVLVFSLLTTGIVFVLQQVQDNPELVEWIGKDAIWSVKDTLTKTSKELFSATSSALEDVKISRDRISATFENTSAVLSEIDLHPVQDFKQTMSFVAGISSKGLSVVSQKADNVLDELTTIIGSSVINSKTVIDTSLANSKTFLSQFLAEMNRSLNKWRKKVIIESDKLKAETKNYFYDLGASILSTSKSTYSFLAEVTGETGDDLKYGINVFQRFSQWYGEQAVVVGKIIKEAPSNIGQKIVKTGITFKQGYQNTNDAIEQKLSQTYQAIKSPFVKAYEFLVSPWGGRTEKKIVAEKEKIDEELKQELEILQARIEKMEREGLPQKEIIKEIQKITQIEPIKEITKELKVLDEESLAEFKTQLAEITGWEADIETLQKITKKLQATPPQTVVSSAPIYIGSQGVQVGGHGTFASLGVSGSAAVHDLGVGDDTVLGGETSDKLTVAATSTFSGPVTINNTLTQSTGQITLGGNVDATAGLDVTGADLTVGDTNFTVETDGNVTVGGDLTVSGAQTYSGSAVFTATSSSDGLRVDQQGTGNIARFQTDGTDNFVIANGGQTTITSTSTPQLTVAYDASNYLSVAVDSSGDLTFTATGGDISFDDENLTTTGTITAGALSISSSGNIVMPDDAWIGLGGSAGRIEFDNQATDEINILNANVGIGTTSPSEKLTIEKGNFLQLPADPVLAGSLGIGTGPYSIYVSGRYAYVVDISSNDLKVIDVSDPTSPSLAGSLGIGSYPYSVYVSGRYAYVVDSISYDLKVIDVSDPTSPSLAGSLGIGTLPRSVYVSGRYAYVVDAVSDDLKVIDVSDPTSPSLAGSLGIGLAPISVYVSGRYAYVVDSISDDLKVIDVSDPTSPSLAGSLAIGTDPYSVYVSGRYAYVVDSDSDDLKVIDVSDPTSPSLAGSLGIGTLPRSVYVSGRYAYVVDLGSDALKVIDVSDPTSPSLAGSLAIGTGPYSVYVSGRYAYVVDVDSDDLKVIDVSGIEATSGVVHSLEAGNLQVRNDIIAQGQLQISGGVNIGSGGLFSAGNISGSGDAYFGGNLGIGTTSPDYKLDVVSNDTTGLLELTGDSITTGTGIALSVDGLTTGTGLDITSSSTAGGASGTSKLLNLARSGANTNASHTTYGLYSSVANTGTTSTNIAGYFSASGATTNYGLIVVAGDVGIGTTAPTDKLTVRTDSAGAVTAGLRIENLGTATVASGTKINMVVNRTTGGATIIGAIESAITNIDNTNYTGKMLFKTASGGSLTTMIEIGNPNIVLSRPLSVDVGGDVGIDYDLAFLSTGTSYITSQGNLTISAGDPNHPENLTLTTRSNEATGDSGICTSFSDPVLTDSNKSWTADEWINGSISIIAGTGKGQTQTITDNANNTITVADWDATLGDPAANSIYHLAYAKGGDVLVNVQHSDLVYGGFKVLGMDGGGYAFMVGPDGDVAVGGTGSGGSDLTVKQNLTLTGGNITINKLDISQTGTPATSITASGGSCSSSGTYYYRVTALNDNGETTISAEGSQAMSGDSDDEKVTVTWSAVPGATSYKLYRRVSSMSAGETASAVADGIAIVAPTTHYADDCSDTTNGTLPSSNATGGDISEIAMANFAGATELTIASGVVTATQTYHKIDTESDGATDDLDTINGGSEGDILVLRAEHTDRSVVLKDATGNLQLSGHLTLDNTQDTAVLVYDGSNWLEITHADSGADIAESYYTFDLSVEPGDVVSILKTNAIEEITDESKYFVEKSASAYDSNLVGVIASQPSTTLGGGYGEISTDAGEVIAKTRPVSLIGRVPVKVNLENGPVEIGDFLTSSSSPGVAMKATGAGRIIGRAFEPFDGTVTNCEISFIKNEEQGRSDIKVKNCVEMESEIGKVMTLVNVSWQGYDLAVITDEEGNILNDDQLSIINNLFPLGLIVSEYGTLEVQKLKAKTVVAEQIEMQDKTTGEIWCTWIENGEWVKEQGPCPEINDQLLVTDGQSPEPAAPEGSEPNVPPDVPDILDIPPVDTTTSPEDGVEPEPEPEPEPPVCIPDWFCIEWSPLPETVASEEPFTQTRTCTDLSDCGIDDEKPTEEQEALGTYVPPEEPPAEGPPPEE